MFDKIKDKLSEKMNGITLSKGLTVVLTAKKRPGYKPRWYKLPVKMLIEQVGDIPVRKVTPDMIDEWWENTRKMTHKRTGKRLSPYTTDSYARGLKAYFGHLVKMGHLDSSPVANLHLVKLPTTSKNAISDDDIAAMLEYAKMSPRNYAIILIFRDSGARLNELATMTREQLILERYYTIPSPHNQMPIVVPLAENEVPPEETEVYWRGRTLVYGTKLSDMRWVFFKHEATLALLDYLSRRVTDDPALWMNTQETAPLTSSGIYLALKAIGKRAGVKTFNPHAFRHRLAKKLKEAKVDPEIIARILGHSDTRTYQAIYGTTTESELRDYHTIYTENV